jgi:hypothetical protein
MSVVETTILLGQSNDFLSPKIKPETPSNKNEFGDKINFLLCGSCFWCASYFNSTTILTRCPTCGNDNVESMPIATGEVYTFSHNKYRGITLEFSNHKGVLK